MYSYVSPFQEKKGPGSRKTPSLKFRANQVPPANQFPLASRASLIGDTYKYMSPLLNGIAGPIYDIFSALVMNTVGRFPCV